MREQSREETTHLSASERRKLHNLSIKSAEAASQTHAISHTHLNPHTSRLETLILLYHAEIKASYMTVKSQISAQHRDILRIVWHQPST